MTVKTTESPLAATSGLRGAATGVARRWDPAHVLEDVQADVSQFLALTPLAALGAAPWRIAGSLANLAALPRVDMFDRDGSIVIKAEVPGVRKDDIDLTVDGDELVIRARHQTESETREEDYYRMERQAGELYRRIPLPEGVQHDRIAASLKDGILEVTAPVDREKTAIARKIEIR